MADSRLDDVLDRQFQIVEKLQASILGYAQSPYDVDLMRTGLQNLAIGIDKLVTLTGSGTDKGTVLEVSPIMMDAEKVGQSIARTQRRRQAAK